MSKLTLNNQRMGFLKPGNDLYKANDTQSLEYYGRVTDNSIFQNIKPNTRKHPLE